ncbi:MAG: hypothetical protein QM528_02665 [Phycisphaerales bacterium]|nr:hypothetical protein [Phycisphaerales bacterium]
MRKNLLIINVILFVFCTTNAHAENDKYSVLLFPINGQVIASNPAWDNDRGIILFFQNGTLWKANLNPNGHSGLFYGVDTSYTKTVFINDANVYNSDTDCIHGCVGIVSMDLNFSKTPPSAELILFKKTKDPIGKYVGSKAYNVLQAIDKNLYQEAGIFPEGTIKLTNNFGDRLTVHNNGDRWYIEGNCSSIADKKSKTKLKFEGYFTKNKGTYPVLVSQDDSTSLDNIPAQAIFFKSPDTKTWELLTQNGTSASIFIENK